jgi:hypothetical protein
MNEPVDVLIIGAGAFFIIGLRTTVRRSTATALWGARHDSIQGDGCSHVGTRCDIRNARACTEEI